MRGSYKFNDGDTSEINKKELENVLSQYGYIEDGHFGTEFIPKVKAMCESARIAKHPDNEFIGIIFNRPTTDTTLPDIIFDLLKIKSTCFFGSDLAFMQSRSHMSDHLPKELKEHFPGGPKVIQQSGES